MRVARILDLLPDLGRLPAQAEEARLLFKLLRLLLFNIGRPLMLRPDSCISSPVDILLEGVSCTGSLLLTLEEAFANDLRVLHHDVREAPAERLAIDPVIALHALDAEHHQDKNARDDARERNHDRRHEGDGECGSSDDLGVAIHLSLRFGRTLVHLIGTRRALDHVATSICVAIDEEVLPGRHKGRHVPNVVREVMARMEGRSAIRGHRHVLLPLSVVYGGYGLLLGASVVHHLRPAEPDHRLAVLLHVRPDRKVLEANHADFAIEPAKPRVHVHGVHVSADLCMVGPNFHVRLVPPVPGTAESKGSHRKAGVRLGLHLLQPHAHPGGKRAPEASARE
mmetsp:Transcript_62524/g.174299  ORF Transcript_62524/g.174299 Transcript_62524/m.174299 type:complete len:339 (-) Transcript_62524:1507-2523(-)